MILIKGSLGPLLPGRRPLRSYFVGEYFRSEKEGGRVGTTPTKRETWISLQNRTRRWETFGDQVVVGGEEEYSVNLVFVVFVFVFQGSGVDGTDGVHGVTET